MDGADEGCIWVCTLFYGNSNAEFTKYHRPTAAARLQLPDGEIVHRSLLRLLHDYHSNCYDIGALHIPVLACTDLSWHTMELEGRHDFCIVKEVPPIAIGPRRPRADALPAAAPAVPGMFL